MRPLGSDHLEIIYSLAISIAVVWIFVKVFPGELEM